MVTEEVDRELLLSDDKDAKEPALVAALVKKQETEDDKDEVWSRLDELTTFGLVGFGFFSCKLWIGTYIRERKATISRQSPIGRDALWGSGSLAPLGNRFSHASAALTWGCLQDTNVPDETILLSDRHPRPQETYDTFSPSGKKYETRGKQPETIDQFLRCTKQHIAIWRMMYGQEHKEERTHAMSTMERLREAHPDLFTLTTIVGAWGEMAFRYIAAVKEGGRKAARMLPETVRKGELRRKALTPFRTDVRVGNIVRSFSWIARPASGRA